MVSCVNKLCCVRMSSDPCLLQMTSDSTTAHRTSETCRKMCSFGSSSSDGRRRLARHICICSPFATILQIERQSARCMCRMHFHFHYHWPGAIAKGSEIKNTNGCASLDNTDSVHFPMRFGANDVLQPEPSATASCSDVYF